MLQTTATSSLPSPIEASIGLDGLHTYRARRGAVPDLTPIENGRASAPRYHELVQYWLGAELVFGVGGSRLGWRDDMRTHGAIVTTVPGRWETVQLDLDEPRQGEVCVRMVAAGLCHSDDHVVTGDLKVKMLPMCGGHEGAGIVEMVGPDTDGVGVGDHVVFSFVPICGECRWCRRGHETFCELGATLARGSRVDDPDSFRLHYDGAPVGQLNGISTFSELTTVDVRSIVRIDRAIPLEVACLVGCGVVTGFGAAVNSGQVQPADIVICMGTGGVGMNAIQGAAYAGADEVIAVDPIESKRVAARAFGATASFATMAEATDYARAASGGQGADCTIITVGVTTGEHIALGIRSLRKAGTLVVAGIGRDVGIPIAANDLALFGKRIQGSVYGGGNPKSDIPHMLELYQKGQLKLDELISKRYSIFEVAQGYDEMHDGRNLRGIITFE